MQKSTKPMFDDGADLPLFSGVPLEFSEATPALRSVAELEQAIIRLRSERSQIIRDLEQLTVNAAAVLDEEEQPLAELHGQIMELERARDTQTAQISTLLWVTGQRNTLDAEQ